MDQDGLYWQMLPLIKTSSSLNYRTSVGLPWKQALDVVQVSKLFFSPSLLLFCCCFVEHLLALGSALHAGP